jgi:hypothetical protein
VNDRGGWRIRTNQELYQLYGENDIVKFCKLSRLRWAGHVIHQDDNLSRRVLLSELGGKYPTGRSRVHWEDGVEEDAATLDETLEGGCSAIGESETEKQTIKICMH